MNPITPAGSAPIEPPTQTPASQTDLCAICLKTVPALGSANGDLGDREIVWLHDIHPFCWECLEAWFAASLKYTCPTCRENVRNERAVSQHLPVANLARHFDHLALENSNRALLEAWRNSIMLEANNGSRRAEDFINYTLQENVRLENLQKRTILYATERGNLQIVRILIEANPSILTYAPFPRTITVAEEAIEIGAMFGRLAIIRSLVLDYNSSISESARGRAVLEAAKGGYLSIVQFLLIGSAAIPGRELWEAFSEATTRGYTEIAQFLSEKNAALSPLQRGRDVMIAVNNHQFARLRFLLTNNAVISEEYRIQAACLAVNQDCIDIAAFLLQDRTSIDPSISVSDRELLIRTFAGSNYVSIMKLLLKDEAWISTESWTDSITKAAANGQLDTLKLLWEHSFISTIYHGNPHIMLDNKAAFLRKRFRFFLAIDEAAKNGHLPVVQFLLENNTAPISKDFFEYLSLRASDNGRTDIATLLSQYLPNE